MKAKQKPYVTHKWKNHSSDITLSNGSINITDDNLILLPPHKHIAAAPGGALVLGRGAEHHLVAAKSQIKVEKFLFVKFQCVLSLLFR